MTVYISETMAKNNFLNNREKKPLDKCPVQQKTKQKYQVNTQKIYGKIFFLKWQQ